MDVTDRNDRARQMGRRHAIIVLCLLVVAGCDTGSRTDAETKRESNAAGDREDRQRGNDRAMRQSDYQPVDVTQKWGIDFTYRNGQEREQFAILESLGGGVAALDFDQDGFDDLFCPGGGSFGEKTTTGFPAEMYRNLQGDGMTAVALQAAAGFPSPHYSHGAFAADWDSDGFQDVLVTGYGGLQFWRNQGDGTFAEVHDSVGLTDDGWSSAAAWGDFNSDGNLDLYVAHYVDWSFDNHPFCRGRNEQERDICPPREYGPLRDTLYISNPDGSFSNATDQWGLREDGKGLGLLVADFDGNGFVDVYVANDTTNNFLYYNDGQPPFRETAVFSGVAADKAGIPNGSMGVDLCDFDQTGRPDIWVTNYEREDFALYRNEGSTAFLHVSDIAGLNVLGGLFVGFGTKCVDIDLNGEEDILVNNGHVILHPSASPRFQLPLVMLAENRRFARVTFDDSNYLMQPHCGRGLAVADLDRDGDLDTIYSNLDAPLAVLRNDLQNRFHWLQVRLCGTVSSRDAVGASVKLSLGDRKLLRTRTGGGSYMSTSQESLSWGLGDANQIDSLIVDWPSGRQTIMKDVAADQFLRIVEPTDGE
jgi:hypothetical protein